VIVSTHEIYRCSPAFTRCDQACDGAALMPSMWRRSTIRLFLLVAVTVASIHFEGDLSLQASFAIVAVIACSWSWTDNAIQPAFSPHQISLEPRIGLMLIDLGFMDDAQWKALFVPEKESDPWSGLTLAKSGARAVVLSLASSGDMIVQLASPTARFEFPWALGSTLEFPEPFFPCSPAFFFDLGNLGRAKYFAQNSSTIEDTFTKIRDHKDATPKISGKADSDREESQT